MNWAPGEGSRLAGYRIGPVIGRGGMGIVYEAEHLALGRTVALKIVAPELASDLTFRERFLREARMAAAMEHPAIIPIYDAGEADGVVYIAMRRVHGADLAELLRGGESMGVARAVEVLAPVASALDAAHRRRLVHRDVKPQNILIEPASEDSASEDAVERVFLTDFGLTKRTDDSGGLTRTGVFVGTFRYAAPEQFQGQSLDGRTDQYALACVAQQCLTGSPPFAGDTDPEVMFGHLAAPPPPITALRPDLPLGVDAVFQRALAKEKEGRFDTCAEFVGALRAAAGAPRPGSTGTVVAPPPAPVAPPFPRAAPMPGPRPAMRPDLPAPPGAAGTGQPGGGWAPPGVVPGGGPPEAGARERVAGRRRSAVVALVLSAALALVGVVLGINGSSGSGSDALAGVLILAAPPAGLAAAMAAARRPGPVRAWAVGALLDAIWLFIAGVLSLGTEATAGVLLLLSGVAAAVAAVMALVGTSRRRGPA
ncbi:MAG TPA: serine/threonine-protein kinase [Actinomycetota bacterium]